eukprot:CAMPEP_0182544580 /NCGR_PEP_ID=MMETSP1323-20130603/33358_1 /TAXON_ID=236787 /ORGANISM="Florenciella parvula, Strain RCC1693" /LENGTH=36 /DNA_ID= /DNA_START= /DNA_END= /DNA_ORIENTATION=
MKACSDSTDAVHASEELSAISDGASSRNPVCSNSSS